MLLFLDEEIQFRRTDFYHIHQHQEDETYTPMLNHAMRYLLTPVRNTVTINPHLNCYHCMGKMIVHFYNSTH